MKDPAFLFYPNDYIGGTLGFTFEQKGAYIDLLMTQFNRGHMTYDMIAQILGQKHEILWSIINTKFIKDEDGLFYNVRLEIEQNNRKHYTESRRNNKLGKNQYSKKEKEGHMSKHMLCHMEDEDENINILEIIKEVEYLFDKKYINNSIKKTLNKLLKSYSKEEIITAIKWAKNDPFWNTNFLSINKLNSKDKDKVSYIDIFIAKSTQQDGKETEGIHVQHKGYISKTGQNLLPIGGGETREKDYTAV